MLNSKYMWQGLNQNILFKSKLYRQNAWNVNTMAFFVLLSHYFHLFCSYFLHFSRNNTQTPANRSNGTKTFSSFFCVFSVPTFWTLFGARSSICFKQRLSFFWLELICPHWSQLYSTSYPVSTFSLTNGRECAVGEEDLEVRYWTVLDRKSTRLNTSHANISYAVICFKKKLFIKKYFY